MYPLCLTKNEVEQVTKDGKFVLPVAHTFFDQRGENNVLIGNKKEIWSGAECKVIGSYVPKKTGMYHLYRILLEFKNNGDTLYAWY